LERGVDGGAGGGGGVFPPAKAVTTGEIGHAELKCAGSVPAAVQRWQYSRVDGSDHGGWGAAAGEVGVRGMATRALSPLAMQRSNKAKKSAVVRAGGGARLACSPILAGAPSLTTLAHEEGGGGGGEARRDTRQLAECFKTSQDKKKLGII
jgi:hypothetical protein